MTAGVLRGEKARFQVCSHDSWEGTNPLPIAHMTASTPQLFGDTMNCAARIENTGENGKIHVSKDTAELLRAAGKEHWLVKREGELVKP